MTEKRRQIKSFKSGAPKLKPGRKPGPSRTSAAKVMRKAKGLEPTEKGPQAAGGYARAIDSAAPTTHPEVRQAAAKLIAANPELKKPLIRAFVSQEQQFVVKMRHLLVQSAPESVQYLRDLVAGEHESAPHAVRASAANSIISHAREISDGGELKKELSEMTHEEIQVELRALTNALGSQSAEDAEIIEDQVPEVAKVGRRSLE